MTKICDKFILSSQMLSEALDLKKFIAIGLTKNNEIHVHVVDTADEGDQRIINMLDAIRDKIEKDGIEMNKTLVKY
jgi:hypothetical protein